MKLLRELMSVRRIDNDEQAPAEDLDQQDQDRLPDQEGGGEYAEISLDDFGSDDETSDENGVDQEGSSENPYDEGTPEHDAWEAGFAAAQDQGGEEQDIDMTGTGSGEELPAEEMPGEELPPVNDTEDCEMSYSDEEGNTEPCPACGEGGKDYDMTCLRCGGKGYLVGGEYDEEGNKEPCPACDGTGKDYDMTCVRCGGKGYLVGGEYDDGNEEDNEEDLAYDQGRAAHKGKYYTHENPYSWGSSAYRNWMKGFAQAQDAEDRENADRATRGDQSSRSWEDDEENQEEVRPTGKEEPNFGHEHDVEQQDDLELDLGDEEQPTEEDPVDDEKLDSLANQTSEDPNRQGLIRKVAGAHLVYKRQIEDGTYEELWIYNANSNLRGELDIRKAILAGTDIPTTNTTSPDGAQQYEVWASGNAELLQIKGLPN